MGAAHLAGAALKILAARVEHALDAGARIGPLDAPAGGWSFLVHEAGASPDALRSITIGADGRSATQADLLEARVLGVGSLWPTNAPEWLVFHEYGYGFRFYTVDGEGLTSEPAWAQSAVVAEAGGRRLGLLVQRGANDQGTPPPERALLSRLRPGARRLLDRGDDLARRRSGVRARRPGRPQRGAPRGPVGDGLRRAGPPLHGAGAALGGL